MNKRIKEIRENAGLTQEDFGKRIGSARNTIANYETGNRKPSNAVILSICREFNINEEWLRTGNGEKNLQLNDLQNEFARAVNQIYSNDPRAKNLILEYWKLSPKDKELFMTFMEKFVVK